MIFWFSTKAQLDLLFRQQALMARQIDDIHRTINKELVPMATQAKEAFRDLVDAVEHATTVKQAALALIKDMGDRLDSLAGANPTPDDLRALAATIREHADELATKISEHQEDEDDGEPE